MLQNQGLTTKNIYVVLWKRNFSSKIILEYVDLSFSLHQAHIFIKPYKKYITYGSPDLTAFS